MRLPTVATISFALLLLPVGSSAGADGRTPVSLLVQVIDQAAFGDLASQLAEGSTPLGASSAEVARALFAPSVQLLRSEREALLILLLHTTDASQARRELADVLFARLEEIEDWSLLAGLFEAGAATGSGTLEDGLDTAERILVALEDPTPRRAGYERAAIAVAAHARMLVRATRRPDEGGQEDPAVGSHVSALALAETLRAIARLSRSEAVVEAARASARTLLDLPDRDR